MEKKQFIRTLTVVVLGAFGGTASAAYTVTDLGLGAAYAVNEAGQAAGGSNGHAVIYSGGAVIDLGTLGGSWSEARGINNSGQVVGSAFTAGNAEQHAFLYSGGAMSDIAASGGSLSEARGISNSGQVAGWGYSSATGQYAFLYSGGVMSNLTSPGGANNMNSAWAINDAGQVAGINGNCHATLYSAGVTTDLNTLSSDCSYGRAINSSGQVAGMVDPSLQPNNEDLGHLMLYSNGAMNDLGKPFGTDSDGGAWGINDTGQIVGWYLVGPTSSEVRPFLYSAGVVSDLNSLLAPGSGWNLQEAWDINNAGQIVGMGLLNGQQHAFLLTSDTPPPPVPEPETYAMLLAGLGLLSFTARRRKRGA